ncbi:RAB11FIP4.2 family protein [Megaselia abdita]
MSQSTSEPESIDLSYDMWAGQFEFVGPNNNNNVNKNSSLNKSTDSLEDLNLGNFNDPVAKNQPILIDQETFLSLNPCDFDGISSGPNSMVFIENRLNTIESSPPAEKKINFELNNNSGNYKNGGFKLENLKNFKNKFFKDFSKEKDIDSKLNNSVEICDNLNGQFELLQRQVTDLADSQNVAEDRTSRTKTEYAVLQTRYHMLEEQYRDLEIRAEERLAEEQKRNRELLSRVEREASLQQENCQIKVKTIEIECNALKEEVQRLRVLCDKQANDLHSTEEKLEVSREHILSMQDELNDAKLRDRKYEQDKKSSEELMIELSTELERIRTESGPAMPTTSPETLRLEELHQELDELRQKNRALEEQNEELEATVLSRGVEEGRHLLNGTLNSLAQELEEMTQAQLQQAFQEKDEENNRLKHYIDTILLNIVENYPQLLEVKPTEAKSSS